MESLESLGSHGNLCVIHRGLLTECRWFDCMAHTKITHLMHDVTFNNMLLRFGSWCLRGAGYHCLGHLTLNNFWWRESSTLLWSPISMCKSWCLSSPSQAPASKIWNPFGDDDRLAVIPYKYVYFIYHCMMKGLDWAKTSVPWLLAGLWSCKHSNIVHYNPIIINCYDLTCSEWPHLWSCIYVTVECSLMHVECMS